jgi:hypothetical protein
MGCWNCQHLISTFDYHIWFLGMVQIFYNQINKLVILHLWVPKNLKKTPIMHICEFVRWKKILHYAYSQTLKMNINPPFCIFVSSQDEQCPHYVYLWILKMNIDPCFAYLWIPKMKTRPTYAYLWIGSKLGIRSHLLLKYFTRSLFKKNIS